jgi:hypothetical protein
MNGPGMKNRMLVCKSFTRGCHIFFFNANSTYSPAIQMSEMSQKFEVELGHLRDGYPALASWIARDPDNETLIFRRFDRLAARNILHLQAQLIALEHEIDELDEVARTSADFEARQSSRRWETLMKHAAAPEDANRPEKKRVEKLTELNILLREYCGHTVTPLDQR